VIRARWVVGWTVAGILLLYALLPWKEYMRSWRMDVVQWQFPMGEEELGNDADHTQVKERIREYGKSVLSRLPLLTPGDIEIVSIDLETHGKLSPPANGADEAAAHDAASCRVVVSYAPERSMDVGQLIQLITARFGRWNPAPVWTERGTKGIKTRGHP